MTVLYHGSNEIIKNPEYDKGKPYNDYGKGFYCTKHIELAKEWAVSEYEGGYVNSYDISLSNLKILDLLNKKYNILHWLALLLDNREFDIKSPIASRGKQYILDRYLIDISNFDLIIGYRADDSYFSFAKDFLNNTISLEQLSYAMKLGELKEQYVLVSKKAFESIEFKNSEFVSYTEYFPRKKNRDENARELYRKQLEEMDVNGIYLRDIMNGAKINE